ncbi:hypothetical protein OB920_20390 [Halobacteria archaeon HArc-gm2]|nr:hypothetical protein [Halobacteria archaeon HArc-gm2]
MNYHELVDVVAIRLSGLLTRDQKLFERSLDVPPLVDVTPDAEATVENATAAGQHAVDVDTPLGTFEAAYMPWQWRGPAYPTVVYHHGSGEHPFEFGRFASSSFRGLFVGHEDELPVNIVGVRAPFHDRSSTEYARALGDLGNFVGMCASSAALFEAIRADLADRSEAPVVLAGVSLGGFAANLHRACFGTADRYVPLLAGAAFGELFVSSVYRHLVADSALCRPDRLRDVLDFTDEFRAVEADDCAPLLGRYDRIVEYDVQRSCYEGFPVAVIEKGHVTGALAADLLRRHLLDAVRDAESPA